VRGHKTRRLAACINIPSAPDIQDPAAGRFQRTIHDIADAVPRLLHLGHLILLGVPDQGRSQLTPTSSAKSEAQEEVGLAAAGGVRGVEQVSGKLPLGHDSHLYVWQLHLRGMLMRFERGNWIALKWMPSNFCLAGRHFRRAPVAFASWESGRRDGHAGRGGLP